MAKARRKETPKELKVVIPTAKEPESLDEIFISGKKVKGEKTHWLLPSRIVQNSIAILEGDPQAGKSTFLACLTAAVTTGKPWLGRPKCKPSCVLYLAAEEDAGSMVRPRLLAAGANIDRVKFVAAGIDGLPRSIRFPGCLAMIRDAILRYGISLVIADPLSSHMPTDGDLNNEQAVRSTFDQINRVCMGHNVCFLFTRFWRKDRSGPRITWGMGSTAIGACGRSVISIEQPDPEADRRILRVVKCNQASRTPPLSYDLVKVDGVPIMANFSELNRQEDDAACEVSDSGDRDVRQDARRLLEALLRGKDPMDAAEIMRHATAALIGERTLRKAKADLGILSDHVTGENGMKWTWQWPESTD